MMLVLAEATVDADEGDALVHAVIEQMRERPIDRSCATARDRRWCR
jgi:hypothetical protein